MEVPSSPTPSPAAVTGRQSCSAGTVQAATVATSQASAKATMTGQGSSRTAGRAGGSGASGAPVGSGVIGNKPIRPPPGSEMVVVFTFFNMAAVIICFVKDVDARLASDLSLAVVRLARQLRFRRPESPVSLSQLSALATLAKEGAMTPGALAIRERVRPPSMTRVVASLAELGFVARAAHPDDGRQVLVSVSPAGVDLVQAERRASQEWLKRRLDQLDPDQRRTLLDAADLMSAIVDESA
jgi:DNA-binding MarR family transcriptional regulator